MEGAGCGLWCLLLAPVGRFILSLGLFVFLEGKNTELFWLIKLGGVLQSGRSKIWACTHK